MNLRNKTIREIAIEMPGTTRVFEDLQIDYCCGGNRPFAEACESAGISPDSVEEKIAEAVRNVNDDVIQSDQLSPAKLIDLIVEKHHEFTKQELKRLAPLMAKVVRKHGEANLFLSDLQQMFEKLTEDLIPHMQKEELILFPFVKNLEVSSITGQPCAAAPFGSVRNPIGMMKSEHDEAGRLLREIRQLTSDFTAPESACPSFRALYFGLEELEKDLHLHIHRENNLLFPMAEQMESAATQTVA